MSYGVNQSSWSKLFLLQNLMNIDGKTLILFFRPLYLMQGFRSLEHWQLQKLGMKIFDQKFRFHIKKYRISEWAEFQVWKFLHLQKLAQGKKSLPPKGRRPAGGKIFFPRATYWGLFNPWDEEVSIPENHGPFGNYILVRVNQAILCFNLTSFLKNSALIKNFVE